MKKSHQCAFGGCRERVQARGLCTGHYKQLQRKQRLRPLRVGPLVARITVRIPITAREQLVGLAHERQTSVYHEAATALVRGLRRK